MGNEINKIKIGVFKNKECYLLSRHKYKEVTNNLIQVRCLNQYCQEVDLLLTNVVKLDITRDECVDELQRIIKFGVFTLSFGKELVVGGPYLDTSLSWIDMEDEFIVSDSDFNIHKEYNLCLNEGAISSYLLLGLPFYPFETQSFWEGVSRISPFNVLSFSKTGVKEVCNRKFIKLDTSIDCIQKDIRKIFVENLQQIINNHDSFSCDVSGGVDSGCVAYVMDKITRNLEIYHSRSEGNNNSDTRWAELIASDLGLDLIKLSSIENTQKRFAIDDIYINGLIADRPLLWADTEGYVEELIECTSHRRNHVHVIGIGADELFTPMQSTPWSIVNEEGVKSLLYIFKYSFLMKRPFVMCVKDLLDKTKYESMLSDEIELAFGLSNKLNKRELGWIDKISVPSWLSDNSKQKAYCWINSIFSEKDIELSKDRSIYQTIQSLIFQKSVFSQMNEVDENMCWEAPFLGMKMIERSLSIPSRFKVDSKKTKPVLYESLKGFVPLNIFTRGAKGDYSNALFEGYKKACKEYRQKINDFELVKLGIIDAEKLSSELSMPTALQKRVDHFVKVCMLERWLRQVKRLDSKVSIE